MMLDREWYTTVLWTALVSPVLYVVYNVAVFMADVRRKGKAADQFPGEPKHWLWGHLHLYPGPNEAGLAFERKQTVKFPMLQRVCLGPFIYRLLLTHYDTIKNLLKSSGPNEAGLAFDREQTAKFKTAQVIRVGPFLYRLFLFHYDTVKAVLKSSEPKPMGVGVYKYGKDWIGDGLLVSQGAKWARNRRLLTPAFHFDILKPYIAINNDAAVKLMSKFEASAKAGRSHEVFNDVSLATFDVILRCAFSYDDDVQLKGENHPYVQAVAELGDIWVKRALSPWLYNDFIFYLTSTGRTFRKHCDYVHQVSEGVITKRQKILEDQGEEAMRKGRYIDFLDILLTAKDENGKGLEFMEIRDEVDTFMFEGHDTTASAIAWCLYSLAENPECQRKCQEEVDAILDAHDDDTITWEDLPLLKYTTQVIKESMRLHCPVPFIERVTTKDTVIEGKTVPPGSILAVQIYNLHHNPIVWADPMKFDPDRFLPENIEKMDSFAFVPFSAGPRNCIGQNFAMHEQKVVIARIMRRFNLALDPDFKVEKKIGVVMKTQNGMRLKVTLRSH